MNSVTPGERREVAKSLRYLAEMTGEPLENDGQFIEVLKYWIFADFKRYSYDETLTRLADLIDPTCHLALDEELSQELQGDMFRCDKCDAAFPRINGEYQYCPSCGARVVQDDG